jgi:hypothetical protein
MRTDHVWLEELTVTADPDPYFALPKLYGAPAYARPRTPVPESERPFDPDDLPIAAEMTQDERVAVATLAPSVVYRSIGYGQPGAPAAGPQRGVTGPGASAGAAVSTAPSAVGARRLSLRVLADRLGPRSK